MDCELSLGIGRVDCRVGDIEREVVGEKGGKILVDFREGTWRRESGGVGAVGERKNVGVSLGIRG